MRTDPLDWSHIAGLAGHYNVRRQQRLRLNDGWKKLTKSRSDRSTDRGPGGEFVERDDQSVQSTRNLDRDDQFALANWLLAPTLRVMESYQTALIGIRPAYSTKSSREDISAIHG
jgi:hypothetical protein